MFNDYYGIIVMRIFKIAFLLALMVGASSAFAIEFGFYKHSDYSGLRFQMGVNQSIASLKSVDANDMISIIWPTELLQPLDNICCFSARVFLFTDSNFRGYWFEWNSLRPKMSHYGINDELSSVIITDKAVGWVLSKKNGDPDKSGWQYPVAQGVLVPEFGSRNNEASSVFVPKGSKLCLWASPRPTSDVNSSQYQNWYNNPTFCGNGDGPITPYAYLAIDSFLNVNQFQRFGTGAIINLPEGINDKVSAAELRYDRWAIR